MPEEVKSETTNAVLAQKLDSFKELVDTKFNAVEKALTRIETNSSGYASQFELNEFKKEVKETYINKDQFNPVRLIAYGLITVVATIVGGLVVYFLTIKR